MTPFRFPFMLDPIAAGGIQRGDLKKLWRPVGFPIYKSNENPPRFSDIKDGDVFIMPDALPTDSERKWMFAVTEGAGTFRCLGRTNFCELMSPFKSGTELFVTEPWGIAQGTKSHDGKDPDMIWYQYTNSCRFVGADPKEKDSWHHEDADLYLRSYEWRSPLAMPPDVSRCHFVISGIEVMRAGDVDNQLAFELGYLETKLYTPRERFLTTYRDVQQFAQVDPKYRENVEWCWFYSVEAIPHG